MAIMLPHSAGSHRNGAKKCGQQAGCFCAPGRTPAEYVRRSRLGRRCPRPGVGSHRIVKSIAKDEERVMAQKYILRGRAEKCTVCSLARAGSEARQGSESRQSAAGRRPTPF